MHVASLKGPTSIGLVRFMDQAADGETDNEFDFAINTAADEIVPKVIQGDVDIALVPANVASVLYNKTEGAVQVIDINTLGVLNVVTGDASVASFGDLAGHTVYMTGKGATPEYVMNYLLERAGLAGQVTLEFKSEPTEVLSALLADPTAVGVLPEPFKTAAIAKSEGQAVGTGEPDRCVGRAGRRHGLALADGCDRGAPCLCRGASRGRGGIPELPCCER